MSRDCSNPNLLPEDGRSLIARSALVLALFLAIVTPAASGTTRLLPHASITERLIAAERLRDPVAAVSAIRAVGGSPMDLETSLDLHSALHGAVEARGLITTDRLHARLHATISRIPSAVASKAAVLLSGIVSAGSLVRANPALAIDASVAIADLVEQAVPRLQGLRASPSPADNSDDACEVATNLTVENYTILAVGSDENDCYPFAETLLSIDVSGDDRYDNLAGVTDLRNLGFPISVALDVAGDDRYTNGQAYGRAGVGLLFDITGNDSYTSMHHLGQGSAAGEEAVGYLADLAGNDSYACREQCQGFGAGSQYPGVIAPNSVGILWDRSGRDAYSVAVGTAQGYGAASAVGVLLDSSGADTVTAPGRPDFLNVQGASTLLGIGLFINDGAAGDSYVLSEGPGGQGTTRTMPGGVGLFIDFGGADAYSGFAPGSNDAAWGIKVNSTEGGYARGVDCERAAAAESCAPGLVPMPDDFHGRTGW